MVIIKVEGGLRGRRKRLPIGKGFGGFIVVFQAKISVGAEFEVDDDIRVLKGTRSAKVNMEEFDLVEFFVGDLEALLDASFDLGEGFTDVNGKSERVAVRVGMSVIGKFEMSAADEAIVWGDVDFFGRHFDEDIAIKVG